ncbi:MAG: hypothetical protein ABIY63_14595, partial [Fibrobacteria bacterium]
SPMGHWPLGPHRYTYVDFSGAPIQLDPDYAGEREGIVRAGEPRSVPDQAAVPEMELPFSFPWMEAFASPDQRVLAGFLGGGDPEPPQFTVDFRTPWKGKAALSDGHGNMYVFNPATGGYCLADFREWWNPIRKIHGSTPAR